MLKLVLQADTTLVLLKYYICLYQAKKRHIREQMWNIHLFENSVVSMLSTEVALNVFDNWDVIFMVIHIM